MKITKYFNFTRKERRMPNYIKKCLTRDIGTRLVVIEENCSVASMIHGTVIAIPVVGRQGKSE